MTVRDFLSDCLDEIGVISSGETPADSDIQLAFRHANRLLDAWNGDRLKIWSIQEQTFVLTTSKYKYTIGDAVGNTTDLKATRPTCIQSASIILANVPLGLPLDILTAKEWGAIEEKGMLAHRPQKLYYDLGFGPTATGAGGTIIPTGTIYLWPGPIDGSTLDLFTWVQLTQFLSLDDVIAFPPGYQQALLGALAVRLAPVFQMTVDQLLAANAIGDMQKLEQFNASVLRASAGEVTTLNAPTTGMPPTPPPQAQ